MRKIHSGHLLLVWFAILIAWNIHLFNLSDPIYIGVLLVWYVVCTYHLVYSYRKGELCEVINRQ
jgi:hypothetical protein